LTTLSLQQSSYASLQHRIAALYVDSGIRRSDVSRFIWVFTELKFAMLCSGTTISDGGKRERRDVKGPNENLILIRH